MLVAYQSVQPGQPGVGMGVYDISNADEGPRQIGFLNLEGPYSRGCHCLWWVDGEYAHLSTGAADFQPRNQLDDQFYMIVDVRDPEHPVEAGRWWVPGTREGDEAPPMRRHPFLDSGHRLHNANVYPERPDRAYCCLPRLRRVHHGHLRQGEPLGGRQHQRRAALPGLLPHGAAPVQPAT